MMKEALEEDEKIPINEKYLVLLKR